MEVEALGLILPMPASPRAASTWDLTVCGWVGCCPLATPSTGAQAPSTATVALEKSQKEGGTEGRKGNPEPNEKCWRHSGVLGSATSGLAKSESNFSICKTA